LFSLFFDIALAEKMETIISRNVFNTRMRDFYDIYILITTKSQDIDRNILKQALKRTSSERETNIEYELLETDLNTIFFNDGLQKLWREYQKKFPYSNDILWSAIEKQVKKLFAEIKEL
jgi:hypothetical protein